MGFNLKKGLAGLAAIASIAAVAPFIGGVGMAAAAGTNLGTPTLTPTSGNDGTGFNLTLPAAPNNKCTGDNVAGYNVQTFMVPTTQNLSALTFDGSGPTVPASGFKAPLFSGGSPFVDQAPNSVARWCRCRSSTSRCFR